MGVTELRETQTGRVHVLYLSVWLMEQSQASWFCLPLLEAHGGGFESPHSVGWGGEGWGSPPGSAAGAASGGTCIYTHRSPG